METMFASFTSSGITVSSFLICSLVALLCGALIAFTYTRRTRFTQSLVLAVILLPFAVLYLLVFFHIGADRSGEKELSITIPESLDYTEVFDDIFKEYTTHAELTEVKTASLGSLYKLHYRVRLADDRNEKEFLDALRCRNGNLEVRCGQPHTPVEQL